MGAESARGERDQRLDVARGAAIIAIVLVHVVRGLHAAGRIDASAEVVTARAVGLWCLSVFAFVGGTFVPRAVQKVGLREYVVDRVVRLLVIYLIWSLLQGGAHLLAAGGANHGTSVSQIFRIWQPNGQLWYLPFLILVTLVFVPMRPWLPRRAPVVLVGAAALSIVCWGFDGGLVGKQGTGLVVFFVAGTVVGTAKTLAFIDRFSVTQAGLISAVALPVTAVLAIVTTAVEPSYFWFDATPGRVAIGVVLSLTASVAILLFGQAARSLSFVALCGRRSLDIFLAHIILSSGTRVLLFALGVDNVWVILASCMIVGVVGSLVVAAAFRRIGLGWMFDGPRRFITLPRRNGATPRSIRSSLRPRRS